MLQRVLDGFEKRFEVLLRRRERLMRFPGVSGFYGDSVGSKEFRMILRELRSI